MSEEQVNITQQGNAKTDWKRFFNYRFIIKNIPFFFFFSVLAGLYIYNVYYADKLVRKLAVFF